MKLQPRFSNWCAGVTLAALSLLSLVSNGAESPANSAEKERKLIAVLQSDAPADQKAVTCKLLAVYGSAEAVPVLSPLLANEQLASWARIALEVIPGEAADQALRQAVPKLQGRLLVGTINSIGVRRDVQAVGELTRLLRDQEADVVSAAAVALGRIGGTAAAAALKASLASALPAARSSVAEGCIRCAEHFLADGENAAAIELYDRVRKAEVPKQKILEALRGAILARKTEGIPLLLEQLRSPDRAIFQIGLRTARELPSNQATQAIIAEMKRTTPERQPLFLLALADREDEGALPTILDSARTGPTRLRQVAVEVLDRMGKPATVPVLIEVAAGTDAELTQAALVALTRMPGNELDAKLLDHLKMASGRNRQVLIQLAARRQIEGAIPVLVKDAENSDPGIRSSAVQALGSLGTTTQVRDLVRLLGSAQNEKQRDDVEAALLAMSGRIGADCVPSLLPLVREQDNSVRKVALHALASAGGSEALTAVKQAVEDQDPSVQDEAVRTLSTWPNTWPEDETIAEPLLNLAKVAKKPSYQVLAMRGYLQFLQGDKKLRSEEKLAKVNGALPLMTRPEEKRSAIAVLQSIPSSESVDTLAKLAGEPAVAEEACIALVDLAGKHAKEISPGSRRMALQTAVEKSTNEDTKKRAEAALSKIP